MAVLGEDTGRAELALLLGGRSGPGEAPFHARGRGPAGLGRQAAPELPRRWPGGRLPGTPRWPTARFLRHRAGALCRGARGGRLPGPGGAGRSVTKRRRPAGPLMRAPPPAPPHVRPGCRPATATGRGGRPAQGPRPRGRRRTCCRTWRQISSSRLSVPHPARNRRKRTGSAVGVQGPANRADQHRQVPGGRGHRPGTRRADVWQRDPLTAGRARTADRPRVHRWGVARSAAASARVERSCPPRRPRSPRAPRPARPPRSPA